MSQSRDQQDAIEGEFETVESVYDDTLTGDLFDVEAHPNRVVEPDFFDEDRAKVYQDGKDLIYKRHEIILAHYDLSPLAHKMANAAFAQLHPNAEELKPIVMGVSELAHLLATSPQNIYNNIERHCQELQSFTIKTDLAQAKREEMDLAEYERLREHRLANNLPPPERPKQPKVDQQLRYGNPSKSFTSYSVFSEFSYDDEAKRIMIQFNPALAPLLIGYLRKGRGRYTSWFLEMTRDIGSQYGQRLYEICRYILTMEDVKKGTHRSEREFDYNIFREMLGVGKDLYPVFSKFERWVLKAAQMSMRDKDICFDWEVTRMRNGIKTPVRTITIKVFANMIGELPNDLGASDRWLITFNSFTENQRNGLKRKFSKLRIMRNIASILDKIDSGEFKVEKTMFGVVNKAIKDDSAGIEKLKSLPVSTPIEINFVKNFLIGAWTTDTFTEDERNDILEKGLKGSEVAQERMKAFELLAGPKAKETTSASNRESRRRVTKAVMDVKDTDW